MPHVTITCSPNKCCICVDQTWYNHHLFHQQRLHLHWHCLMIPSPVTTTNAGLALTMPRVTITCSHIKGCINVDHAWWYFHLVQLYMLDLYWQCLVLQSPGYTTKVGFALTISGVTTTCCHNKGWICLDHAWCYHYLFPLHRLDLPWPCLMLPLHVPTI